jgi:hypothetical protein
MEIPMLDDAEWQDVYLRIKEDIPRKAKSPSGASFGSAALERYFEITGFRETNVATLGHHRLSMLGPPCGLCGKPLRTP